MQTITTPYSPTTFKKLFDFGKIDYYGNGRRTCLVEIEVELKDGCFSASGSVWNNLKTDIVMGGQCLDSLKDYLAYDHTFKTIYRIWKLYHLNDMQPGSPQQMAYLNTLTRPEYEEFYTWECSKLAEVDLLIDNSYLVEGKPYKYGTRWLKAELPQSVIKEIRDL